MSIYILHVDAFPNTSSITAELFNKIYTAGVFSLDQFFVLSAFLITTRLLQERERFGSISLKDYFFRRALRIWPLYYAAIFTGCFLMPILSMKIERWSYAEFLFKEFLPLSVYVVNFTIPYTQNWLYVYSEQMGLPLIALIVPLWSLSVEEQFYVICPFIARRLRISRKFAAALIGLALFSTILRLVLCNFAEAKNLTHFVWFFNTFARLEPFLVGIAIAALLFLQPNTAEFVKRNAKIIFFLNIGIYACIFFFQPLTSYHEVFVIPLVAIGCGMTVLLTLFCAPLAQILSLAPLRYLGILSYSMYIIHKPVLWTLEHAFKHRFSAETCWFIRLVAGYLITFCLANITYHVIEKGFLRLKRRFSRIQNMSPSTINS